MRREPSAPADTGTAFHALRRLDIVEEQAVAMGVPVMFVDVVPERLKLSRGVGAAAVIDARDVDPVEQNLGGYQRARGG